MPMLMGCWTTRFADGAHPINVVIATILNVAHIGAAA
jgi:hypothetical protein